MTAPKHLTTLEERRAFYREQKRKQREREGPELTRAKWREWYYRNHEHRREYENNRDESYNHAKQVVAYHVEVGNIVKPDKCEGCGECKPLQGHHHDYEDRHTVTWLCADCHAGLHAHVRLLVDQG